ncbi:hypothetical protein BC828DRAFT_389587 [Blastocladiella britannica]|nr:hypothetical protein BC828DRAFT_389587 [Blastocladiella britannica]
MYSRIRSFLPQRPWSFWSLTGTSSAQPTAATRNVTSPNARVHWRQMLRHQSRHGRHGRYANLLDTMSPSQLEAIYHVFQGRNVLIHGPGGTGKSYLIASLRKMLLDAKMQVAVTASTGVAAVWIRGPVSSNTQEKRVQVAMLLGKSPLIPMSHPNRRASCNL